MLLFQLANFLDFFSIFKQKLGYSQVGAIKTMSVMHTHAINYIIVTCAVQNE
jgi:hypothetical protein